MTLRSFSFGGGVQSTAALVLQAQNKLPKSYDAFLFSNVGDDSEHPETIEYFNKIHKPYADKHNINLIELKRIKRDGSSPSLLEHITNSKRAIDIPVHLVGGGPGNRNCTVNYKVKVIHKWQKQNGATVDDPAVCGLGISTDEIQRARTNSGFDDQVLEYPLIDLKLNRNDCMNIIKDAGLPPAPRSACWFCPFHKKEEWRSLKRERRDLFDKAVKLEKLLGDRREELGRDRVYLTSRNKPLDEVVDDQLVLDFGGAETCDTGHCFI